MIIDCFSYFNEKELLELRVNLLYDKVDKFVITEGNHTHKGDPKKFTFLDTAKSLNLPMNKIIYIQVNLPSAAENPDAWVRERMQRDAASVFINEGDIAFVSDLDEIINPDLIEYYISVAKKHPTNILRVPLVFLCSKANLRVHKPNGDYISWSAPFIVTKDHLETYTLSDIRESHTLGKNNISYSDIYITENNQIIEAGWHFTWMGDETRRQQKLNAFLHWDEVKLTDNYESKNGSFDPLGRKDHILSTYPEENLPALINDLPRVKEFLFGTKSELSVIQLGTNKANDNLSDMIHKKYSNLKLGIFVEANPAHIKDIEKCYSNYQNVYIENVGIKTSVDDPSEVLTFYVNSKDGPGYEIASTDINHIYKHMETVPHLLGGLIETFKIPCISLDQLFNKYHVKELDLLVMDLEGMDADVILNFDFTKYNVKKIEFEQLHLGNKRDMVKSYLVKHGYTQVKPMHEFNYAFENCFMVMK